MREIKFRAWNKDTESMFDEYITVENRESANSGNPRRYTEIESYYGGPHIEELIPMQYTGLKDKNGVEIYEGDILKTSGENYGIEWVNKNIIIWGQKGGFHAEGTTWDSLADCVFDLSGNNRSEVIGNIYENKDLLDSN